MIIIEDRKRLHYTLHPLCKIHNKRSGVWGLPKTSMGHDGSNYYRKTFMEKAENFAKIEPYLTFWIATLEEGR